MDLGEQFRMKMKKAQKSVFFWRETLILVLEERLWLMKEEETGNQQGEEGVEC